MSQVVNPSIEFVYFDLGNVIAFFDHELGCQQVISLTGLPGSRIMEIIFDSGMQDEYETGKISSQEFVDTFASEAKIPVDGDQLLRCISNIFTVNRSMLPVITQLAHQNFPRGILSNTCQAHWEFLCIEQVPTISELLPLHILSFRSESMKPDQKIYRDAIELAGVDASKIFFVDDRQENVQGARDAGIDAVLFESTQQLISELATRGLKLNI